MKMTQALEDALARIEGEPMAMLYREAVERIDDFTDDRKNPYWHAPGDASDGIPGEPMSNDEMGGQELPENMRDRAWELLVLADLIDAATGQIKNNPEEGDRA